MSYNDSRPIVSIIMPAYNAEKFIGRAIESVLQQDYSNIELIICDDASTDNTCLIAEKYNDSRVKIIKEKHNSGSAYVPRYKAYMHSIGEYVLNLDADDFLALNYIDRMMSHIFECQADICCGWTIRVNEDEKELKGDVHVPKDNFDFSVKMTGKEAFFYTVPDWTISMAGVLAKRKIWELGFKYNYKDGVRNTHDDENTSRCMLLNAKNVVFAKVKYFYTMNPSSVTHVFSDKSFTFMKSEEDLLCITKKEFGVDSLEYRAVEASDYNAYCQIVNALIESSNVIDYYVMENYLDILMNWHRRLNWKNVKKFYGQIKGVIDENFLIGIFIRTLKKSRSIKKSISIMKLAYKTAIR